MVDAEIDPNVEAHGDPVDQLVPPPGRRGWLVVLLAATYVVLGLAAVAPTSGVFRPNLVLTDAQSASAGRDTGDWSVRVENHGWTTATVEGFDLGLAGVEAREVTFVPTTSIGLPSAEPVSIAAGEGVTVHVRFRYDCATLGREQRSTMRARGLVPAGTTVDLRTRFAMDMMTLSNLLDAACDHPA